jgi:hypothetical protein
MAGEHGKRLTGEHPKEQFRAVFRAMHADLRHWPGGTTAVAEQLGKHAGVLCNKFNPDCLDHAPTLHDWLQVMELIGAKRAASALALLVGQVAVDVPPAEDLPVDVVLAFLDVVQKAGALMSEAASDLADGRLDAQERERAAVVLDALLGAAMQMRALLRS